MKNHNRLRAEEQKLVSLGSRGRALKEDVAKDIELVEQLVGRVTSNNHQLLEQALEENRGGVMSLASRLATSGARSPVAVLITNLRAGEHKRGAEVTQIRSRSYSPMPRATPEEMARFKDVAAQWKYINGHLHDPRINEVWQECKKLCRGYVPAQSVHELLEDGQHHVRGVRPSYADPTDEEARMIRETLIYAIQHPEALEITA